MPTSVPLARDRERAQQPATVLVVDDDELVREMAATFLAMKGYRVIGAGSGDEAVAVLNRASGVDVVFTDLRMPGRVDGIGLARWIRDHRPRTRVLITSGYASGAQQVVEVSNGPLILKEAGPAVYRILDISLPGKDEAVTPETFSFKLNWQHLREARRREGSYLLRSNLTGSDAGKLWAFYLQLVEVEQAFKELKGDLAIRPIYHQSDQRIEAHIFVAFMAYCLHVTLKQRTRSLAPGLTPRAVLDKMAAIQMVDVHLPTTDGRQVVLSRYTEPEPDQILLLQRLRMTLPDQPPPRITVPDDVAKAA